MTIKALFPTVRPTLNLDFAKTKALDPRVTFTRASTATFVGSNGLIQTAASGAARFDHNPATGESLGLLVEEAGTNLRTNSENVSTWASVGGQGNATAVNVIAAPDGNTTADNRYGNSGSWTAANLLESNATVASGQSIVMSVHAKYVPSSKYQWISLNLSEGGGGNDRVVFNLQTGAITVTSAISGYAQNLPNGWFRLVAVYTNTSGSSQTWGLNACRVFALNTSNGILGDGSGTGSAVDGVYLWGGQVEVITGAFPTSYIPTTTATVTRAADVASMTGANFSSWYRQDEGTILSVCRNTLSGTQTSIGFDDATSSNQLNIYSDSTTGYMTVVAAGSVVANLTLGTLSSANKNQFCGTYKLNSYAATLNSGLVLTDTSGAVPAITQLRIGSSQGGSSLFGTIARLTYWPTRLPDAQLQALTAT